jgi:protein phosphatase
MYAEPARPFLPDEAAQALTAQQALDDVLDLADVQGKRIVHTRLHRTVTVREENATAALEVMSRFAVNPKWLIYLPPTMSPSETTTRDGLLEHPAEAFAYFRTHGVPEVMCQEKHMGSRAVVVVCRDTDVARRRFGIVDDGDGVIYTRTGRRFFDDTSVEQALLTMIRDAFDRSGFWETLSTDWACLDCELMPWSAKAQELIRRQYAAVGAAATTSLGETMTAVRAASARGVDASVLIDRYGERQALASSYVAAYSRYCWPVTSVHDLRLAPFHVMATERAVHSDKDHAWHMRMLASLTDVGGPVLFTTRHRTVNVTDPASEEAATAWWEEMTAAGGEGMVVKPMAFVANGTRGLAQPAVKCRGREYLRIIYGPEYTLSENLGRLRQRGLHAKRSLALREFALGIEALERFVRHEPLRRVHECVFGVLALESEPVDPRL